MKDEQVNETIQLKKLEFLYFLKKKIKRLSFSNVYKKKLISNKKYLKIMDLIKFQKKKKKSKKHNFLKNIKN